MSLYFPHRLQLVTDAKLLMPTRRRRAFLHCRLDILADLDLLLTPRAASRFHDSTGLTTSTVLRLGNMRVLHAFVACPYGVLPRENTRTMTPN